MSKLAFIFPGQGSQSTGMGQDFYNNSESAKQIFDFADKVLEKPVSKLCFQGSDEELKLTLNSQPAILSVSLAAYEAFKEKTNISPDYVLGHSLGEIAAYYVSGVLNIEDTFKLIKMRAKYMNDATLLNKGKMTAVIGADIELIKKCISEVDGICGIANYNSLVQVVISGDEIAVDEVCAKLKAQGVKKVIQLAVSGAFHSQLMKPAADNLEKYVENIAFNDAKLPVITNVDGKETLKAVDFKTKVVEQIFSSVLWTQSIQYLIANGVDTFIEFGNGHVLTGLIKRINSDVNLYNVSDMQSLNETIEKLGVK